MAADNPNKNCEAPFSFLIDATDAALINRMRLVLAISGLLTVFIDAAPHFSSMLVKLVFAGYGAYSAALCLFARHAHRFINGKLIHWGDLCWHVAIVALTGFADSMFFPFLLFVILTSSFRHGFEEGARIAIAAAAIFTALGLVMAGDEKQADILMHTAFLLALGYMSACWGESKVVSKRRLALLKDVSHLSNPRFGVDRTMTAVLAKLQVFFGASACLLIAKEEDAEIYAIRSLRQGSANSLLAAETIDARAASPFLEFPQAHSIVFSKPGWRDISFGGRILAYDHRDNDWIKCNAKASERLADLLEATSFISTPISFNKEKGRLYVATRDHALGKTDALFLSQVVAHVFPVLENIQLLDRLASEAAQRERQRIAWDIHDSAIQPYIGLKLSLHALCNKAGANNPLAEDLEKLTAMTNKVVEDLRHYAKTIKNCARQSETLCLTALRRQAEQLKELYGIDILVSVAENLRISDRLAAEVLQIAREGLSNIRKHTTAQHGAIRIHADNVRLSMQIENECEAVAGTQFMPHTIAERAAGLGGKTYVKCHPGETTVVHVDIPI